MSQGSRFCSSPCKSSAKVASNLFEPFSCYLLRGGRLSKIGRRLVSYAPVVGLVGLAAVFGSADVNATQCGAMLAGGAAIVCDVNTYTPATLGDGTSSTPGLTPIVYSGGTTYVNNTSIVVNNLVLDTRAIPPATGTNGGVTLVSNMTANPGLALRIDLVGDNTISSNATAVFVDDRSANSGGSALTTNGVTLLKATNTNSAGLFVFQRSNSAAGNVDLSMQGNTTITTSGTGGFGAVARKVGPTGVLTASTLGMTSITTTGDGGHGLYAWRQGDAATANSSLTTNGTTTIYTSGANSKGIYLRQSGSTGAANNTGDITAIFNGDTTVTTTKETSHGVLVLQESATSDGTVNLIANDNTVISTAGMASHGLQALKTGANATGDVNVVVSGNSRITTTGFTARAVYARSEGMNAVGASTVTMNDTSSISTSDFGSHAAFAMHEGYNERGDLFVTLNDDVSINTAGDFGIGAYALFRSVSGEGDTTIDLNNNASITTTGRGAYAAYANQSGTNGAGAMVIDVDDDVSVSTSGYGAHGLYAHKGGYNSTGSLLVNLDGSASIATTGEGADGILASSLSQNPVDVDIAIASGSVTTTGLGAAAVRASVSAITPLLNANNAHVYVPGVDADNNPVQVQVFRQAENTSSSSARIQMTGGTVTSTGDRSIGLVASTSSASGGALVNASNATVNVYGESSTAISAVVKPAEKVLLDSSGDAVVVERMESNGDIVFDTNRTQEFDVLYQPGTSDNAQLQTGSTTINIDSLSNVTVSGQGAVAVSATNMGSGSLAVHSAANITASGVGSTGILIDTSMGTSMFSLDLTGGVVSAEGTSIKINTGTGSNGTANIASGVQVGSAASGSAIHMTGAGSASFNNAGVVLGGVYVLGEFANTGTVTFAGNQGFGTSGGLVNSGVIDAADGVVGNVIAVGGSLSGSGKFLLDVNLVTGAKDQISVNGDLLNDTDLTIDAKIVSGEVSVSSAKMLENILTVDGSVEDGASVVVNAGLLKFDYTSVDGKLSDLVVRASDKGEVYAAAPMVLASNFARIASTQTRFNNRVYSRKAENRDAFNVSLPFATGVKVASLDGLVWLAYADELSRTAPQRSNDMVPRQSGAWASLTSDSLEHSRSTGAQLKDSYHEFEGGVDRVLSSDVQGTLVLSTSAHIGSLSSNMSNPASTSESTFSSTGFGVNVGATYFLTNGMYVDGSVRISKTKSDIASAVALLASDVKSTSVSGSLELGRRFDISENASITPSVQLSFGETKVKSFTDSNALRVESSSQKTNKARVGVAFENALPHAHDGSTYRLSANYVNDFSPASSVSAGGTTLDSKGKREWLDFGVGATWVTNDKSGVTFDVAYSFAKGARSTNNGVRATVGYQMNF